MQDNLDEEILREALGEGEDEPKDQDVAAVTAAFGKMEAKDRSHILMELLANYCPECGRGHEECRCEISPSVTPSEKYEDIES